MARIALYSIALFTFGLNEIHAQSLSGKNLDRLKQGTVFVRAEGESSPPATGFIIADDGVAFAITHSSVLSTTGGEPATQVQVTTNPGAPNARTRTAHVVFSDPDDEIVILSLTGENLPKPIELVQKSQKNTILDYWVLGFPAGEKLDNGAIPEQKLSRLKISATRSEESIPWRYQLSELLPVGHSGAPIAIPDGRVCGMVIARPSNSSISSAVTVDRIRRLLRGRIKTVQLSRDDPHDQNPDLDVRTILVDPLKKIQSVSIVTMPIFADELKYGENENPLTLPNAREHKLRMGDGVAQGRVTFEKTPLPSKVYGFFTLWKRTSGEIEWSVRTRLDIPRGQKSLGPMSVKLAAMDSAPPETLMPRPEWLQPDKVTRLAGEVDEVCVAANGRYLVLKLRGLPALTVFDCANGTIAKSIRLPTSNYLFAAGGNTAVVYFVDENVLQRIDLTTFEVRETKPNPFGAGHLTNLIMGAGCDRLIMVRHAADNVQSDGSIELMYTQGLQPVSMLTSAPARQKPSLRLPRERVLFRSNSDLSTLLYGPTSDWMRGVIVRNGNELEERSTNEWKSTAVPGENGRVYTERGEIWSTQGRLLESTEPAALFPAMGGGLYVALNAEGRLTLYQDGQNRPVGVLGTFPDWVTKKQSGPVNTPRTGDHEMYKRVHFAPRLGLIALIPQKYDQIVVRRFDLKAALESSGANYLLVSSLPPDTASVEQPWIYQLETLSKSGEVRYTLARISHPTYRKGPSSLA